MVLNHITKIYFPIFVMIGGLVYGLQHSGFSLPWYLNYYLNDFLCMPIVLFLCQYGVRKIKGDSHIKLPFSLLVIVTVGFAVYFEYWLPNQNPRYTADAVDVLLYFMGLLFFYSLENKVSKKPIMSND